ncbi:hypothetical protein GCM10023352_02510 [Rothia endophytica]|uniref:Secreted protein n=1 Tax=Rothia endophytica TaxID=1324766 RepID=A0ABP9B2C5_9MICC
MTCRLIRSTISTVTVCTLWPVGRVLGSRLLRIYLPKVIVSTSLLRGASYFPAAHIVQTVDKKLNPYPDVQPTPCPVEW